MQKFTQLPYSTSFDALEGKKYWKDMNVHGFYNNSNFPRWEFRIIVKNCARLCRSDISFPLVISTYLSFFLKRH